MLVWLNGAFGVGKTTTARLIAAASDVLRPFDPEWVGYMLKANLSDKSLGGDFQHLSAWRRLVPVVAREVSDFAGEELIAVQTVLEETYWQELRTGLTDQGFDLLHVLLDVEPSILRARIAADSHEGADARQWRLEHVDVFESSRSWMVAAADLVVDTTSARPEDVAMRILESCA